MPHSSETPDMLRFGVFEVNLREGELRKSGLRVKLQDQPLQVLVMLLERPGEMVSREELQRRLWPADTFVDFDHSLNSAIKKVREALGDQAENPQFIETLHRRGYRFIAPVEGQLNAAGMGPGTPREAESGKASTQSARRAVPRWAKIVGAVAALLAAGSVVTWWVWPLPPPRVLNYTQITKDGADKIEVASIGSIPPPLVTDGSRLYFTEQEHWGRNVVGQVSVTGGETAMIPTPFPNAAVLGISPSGSDLLVYTWQANELLTPLWAVPILGGTPRRVGEVTTDATWSSDGQIVYGQGHDLYVAKSDGSQHRRLASVAGLPVWPRWSPDGKVLRFTEHDPNKDSSSLWQVAADGTQLHRRRGPTDSAPSRPREHPA